MHIYFIFAATLLTSATTTSSKEENDTVIDDLLKQKPCLPFKVYTKENVFCVCNEDGTWPSQKCQKTFDPTAEDKNNANCEPNGYVTIKCNVCKCNEKGKIDYEHCTQNDCENNTSVVQVKKRNDNETRRISRIYYGACKPNTFYSVSTCKFCFCTEKFKLVCKDTGSQSTKRVKVGVLKLIECATDIKKDIDALIKDENVVYKAPKPTKSTLRKATKSKNKQNSVDVTNGPFSSDDDFDVGNNDKKKKSKQADSFTHIPFEPADRYGRYAADSQEKGSSQEDSKSFENVLRDQDDSDNKDEINDFAQLEEQGIYKKKLLRSGNDLDTPEFKNKGVENVLDPDIPKAIRNFHKRRLARRNALMSVVDGQPCVSGSVFTIKCNTCFCLKNGNTICTKKNCMDDE